MESERVKDRTELDTEFLSKLEHVMKSKREMNGTHQNYLR